MLHKSFFATIVSLLSLGVHAAPAVNMFPTGLVASSVSPVVAQSSDAGALQQQLQHEIEHEGIQGPSEPLLKKKLEPSKAQESAQTIEVKSFKITGITLVTQKEVQEVVRPFTNRKLTFGQIREAANAVTNLYKSIGRVAQAIIPPQNVENGQIEIKIVEGKVGDVVIELDKAASCRLKSDVIKKFIWANNEPGSYISLNGLERSLALLNEIPGNEINGELTTGTIESTSNIQVNAKDTGQFAGRLDISNYGSANTGIFQALGNLSINNPSGNGDQATIDIVGSEGSVYGQLKYGMPLGYDGWRLTGGVSALNYKSLASFSSTIAQGTAQTYGLYSSYAWERTASSNKNLIFSYENKNYNNLSNSVEISNYQINDLNAGINGSYFMAKTYLNWGVTATLGNLSFNNAQQAAYDTSGASTQGSFGKLSFNGSITQALPIDRTNLIASIYGQLANKNLNSAEQLYLGGPYGVRAYPVAQGGGAQGAVTSIEINHTYQNHVQLGAFFDAGLIQQYINFFNGWQGQTNAGNIYPLYATGLLSKYSYHQIQLSATLAYRIGNNPLYNQSGQQLNVDNQYRIVQGWIKGTVFF